MPHFRHDQELDTTANDLLQLQVALHQRLTAKQREFLEHFAAGRKPKEIAFAMKISEQTVSTHKEKVLHKLNLQSDFQLIVHLTKIGLVH